MKRFGPRLLFRGLSLEVAGGESLAVTGPNGSGKSTLLKILAGVAAPGEGKVVLELAGRAIRSERRPQHVGLVAPFLNLYDAMTPRENLRFLERLRGLTVAVPEIERLLDEVGLLPRADDRIATFSSGMKQRMRLAAALLADPPVLLLDEPSLSLDEAGIAIVRRFVVQSARRGRVVVLATNNDSEAAMCDGVLQLGGES